MSHPSRVRGLKLIDRPAWLRQFPVAPLAGAWIEICLGSPCIYSLARVAPLAGAWIEMSVFELLAKYKLCRTPRGCVD